MPLFRTVYAPVKQLMSAFSPESDVGLQAMVLVEDQTRGAVLGFLTKEFTVDRGKGAGDAFWLSMCRPTTSTWAIS